VDGKIISGPNSRIRVRYSDVDRMGLLYHVNYLEYFEIGRSDWIRWFWKPYKEIEDAGFALVVIEASIKFISPGRYDDEIDLVVSATDWGHSRLIFDYKMTDATDGHLLCEGRTAHCFIDKNAKPIKMPDALRELLNRYPHLNI
jgi:acyl-CoA thioester hydrolase